MNKVKSKVTAYYQIQKLTNTIGNQLWMYEHKDEWMKKRKLPPMPLEANEKELLKVIYGDVKTGWEGVRKKKDKLKRELETLGKNTEIWVNWLKDVKGIGGFTAAVIDARLMNKDFPFRSNLTGYVGYNCTKGKATGKIHGKAANYNHIMRAFCWNIGECLIKAKGEYYQYYLRQKKIYTAKYPDYVTPKGGWRNSKLPAKKQHPKHLHKLAERKMVKLFLSHLFEEMWRIKNPEIPIPRAMHYRDIPLKEEEYIAPIRDK